MKVGTRKINSELLQCIRWLFENSFCYILHWFLMCLLNEFMDTTIEMSDTFLLQKHPQNNPLERYKGQTIFYKNGKNPHHRTFLRTCASNFKYYINYTIIHVIYIYMQAIVNIMKFGKQILVCIISNHYQFPTHIYMFQWSFIT